MDLYKLVEQSLFEDEDDLSKFEIPEYNEEDIEDALKSNKPEVELKEVFGADFWPKVQRWLNQELKDIKITKEDANVIGGPLRAKLNVYLEKEEQSYEENVKSLTRAIINAYKSWSEKQVKDKDLPQEDV